MSQYSPDRFKKARVVVIGDADESFMFETLFDKCKDAGNRASSRFSPEYPGWQLYCRIARGDYRFDRDLEAWAIRMARMYTRTRKINGQTVVAPRGRRNDWIAYAGRDALLFVIYGRFPESYNERSEQHGVHPATYKKVTEDVGICMLAGFEQYRSELHYSLSRVKRENAEMD
jgi:hypothetical protein